jgi:dGTP triphosphohydrolase
VVFVHSWTYPRKWNFDCIIAYFSTEFKRACVYAAGKPEKIPQAYHYIIEQEGVHQAACDYIAGMSDRYLVSVYKNIFIPDSWVDMGWEG